MNKHVSEVASLSHDIRNMMSSILIASQVLEDSADNRTVDLAKRISKAADACTAFCRAAIDAEMRPRVAKKTNPIFLADVLDEVVGQFSTRRDDPISFRINCASDLAVRICRARLQRVLFNLIKNSVDAICRSSGTTVDVNAREYNGLLVIEISDDGPGFDASKKHILMQDSKKADSANEHQHGIGLPTVAALIDQMGGRLTRDKAPRKGASFRLYFPDCIPNAGIPA